MILTENFRKQDDFYVYEFKMIIAGAFVEYRWRRIGKLEHGAELIIKPEEDNEYDDDALTIVNERDQVIGYIPKEDKGLIYKLMDKAISSKIEFADKYVVDGYKDAEIAGAFALEERDFIKLFPGELDKIKTPIGEPTEKPLPTWAKLVLYAIMGVVVLFIGLMVLTFLWAPDDTDNINDPIRIELDSTNME